MKRDMDLVREILRAIEARPATSPAAGVQIDGREFREVGDHLKLMQDAGLVEGARVSSTSASCARLTWQGYEFLEASRKETTWNKAKEIALSKTGGLSIVAITEAIKEAIQSAMS